MNAKTVYPLSGRGKPITYFQQGNTTIINWGSMKFKITDEQVNNLLANFFTDKDKWYLLGTNMTGAPEGSFGNYISTHFSLTPRHGSAIAPILVNEQVLDYRGKKPLEVKKRGKN